MDQHVFDMAGIDIAWCPGCGNFNILRVLKQTLAELEITPEKLVLVSGIGQAAKLPHYLKTNLFNGLHGRSLPVATAIKAAHPALTVIAQSGDGCMYAEGGNHFMHTIRRNPDITHIVHNNMVYGLTKGQAAPTSQPGFCTKAQPTGVCQEPFNPLAVAIALNAPFVARSLAFDSEHLQATLKAAIQFRGYALVDILQPCVSFNQVNTHQWYLENTYYLPEDYTPNDRVHAFAKAIESDKLPLGILYCDPQRSTFEQTLSIYREDNKPLYKRDVEFDQLATLIAQTAE